MSREHDPESPQLPPAHIQGVVRAAFGTMNECYGEGLTRNPNLHGRVVTRFVIDSNGAVKAVLIQSNTLPDCEVVSCIARLYAGLRFHPPKGGTVTVVYPLRLEPR